MSSGKSTLGKLLSKRLNYRFIDLDEYISAKIGMTIPQIFEKKGELFFRKLENESLQELLQLADDENVVISLGGGTPCYYNHMELLKNTNQCMSFYLKLSLKKLVERLWTEKDSRPLISHYQDKDSLDDFVRKHIFERQFYYLQADETIDTTNKNLEEVFTSIQLKLN